MCDAWVLAVCEWVVSCRESGKGSWEEMCGVNPTKTETLELVAEQYSEKVWMHLRVLLFEAGFANWGPFDDAVVVGNIRTTQKVRQPTWE